MRNSVYVIVVFYGWILSSGNGIVFRMGVILPYAGNYPWIMPKIMPAIEYAVDTIHNSTQLTGHQIIIMRNDSKCSDTSAPLAAIDMFLKNKPSVFIGPACDYSVAPIARFSPYWNIPVITAGAFVNAFVDKKNQYKQLTRMLGSYAKLGQFVATLYRKFDWNVTSLIYNMHLGVRQPKGRTSSYFIMESIHEALRVQFKKSHRTKEIKFTHFDEDATLGEAVPGLFNVSNILVKSSMESRIIVLCASRESIREIMMRAAELGFCNGEYVFINIDLFSSTEELARPWIKANASDEENEKARLAFDAMLTITLRRPSGDEYENFSNEVKRRARIEYGNSTYGNEEVNSFVAAFHDSVILYALALNETLRDGEDPLDGATITRRMWNRTFQGITGPVRIDENGDRNVDYSLLDFDPSGPEDATFQVVGNYFGIDREYTEVRPIHWAGGVKDVPKDTPKCGFDGSLCPPEAPFPIYGYIIAVLGTLLLVVLTGSLIGYKKYKYDQTKYDEKYWRVRWEDVKDDACGRMDRGGSMYSLREIGGRRNSLTSHISVASIMAAGKQIFATIARYKDRHVVIKKISHSINVKPSLLKEIKRMRDLQNNHVVQLVGICTDPGYESILTEYCPKGSLEDVLEDENLDLDLMFKLSLIQDLVRGMDYLHNSEIHYHGNLKTSNCVVDGRFVLKVTDFGLQTLRRKENESDITSDRNAYFKAKLWTAPELLRQCKEMYKDGLQKADVYSFGIISQEIIYRKGPFWLEDELDITPEEVVTRIKDGKVTRPSLPCSLDAKTFPTKLLSMIKTCWSENSSTRPDFHNLLRTVNSINKEAGCSGDLMDNLLTRMENYARNLEDLVKERTAGYLEQKKRAEDLLYRMLPESVAEQLMRGQRVEAEKFDSVTIYFSDICGFTKLSSDSTPIQVVDLLNDLYTTFDAIVDNLDVYKVETIGDAYMVVSGLPNRNGMDHAREISRMSLQLLNAVKSFRIRHKPDQQLLLRIGLHSGPVCAGVVGRKMPRYCLFGDTVNTASRMESNGEALKIHVSPYTKEILDTFGTFVMTVNKVIEPKGKQPMLTWWLLGENHPDFPDLAPIDNTTVIPSSQPVENRESAC